MFAMQHHTCSQWILPQCLRGCKSLSQPKECKDELLESFGMWGKLITVSPGFASKSKNHFWHDIYKIKIPSRLNLKFPI